VHPFGPVILIYFDAGQQNINVVALFVWHLILYICFNNVFVIDPEATSLYSQAHYGAC
jgi:hypothetical protein